MRRESGFPDCGLATLLVQFAKTLCGLAKTLCGLATLLLQFAKTLSRSTLARSGSSHNERRCPAALDEDGRPDFVWACPTTG